MTVLAKLVWGGVITDAPNGGSPIEEWTNSLYTTIPSAPALAQAESVAAHLSDWHEGSGTDFSGGGSRSDTTVRLDWVKYNEITPSTGHQTDPDTVLYEFPTPVFGSAEIGGGTTLHNPTSTSIRVSIDDGTRNRRHKGGFFIPRVGVACLSDGRIDPEIVAGIADDSAKLLGFPWYLDAIWPVVYSTVNRAYTDVSRVRVGNVLDNISRRKNELREVYEVRAPEHGIP